MNFTLNFNLYGAYAAKTNRTTHNISKVYKKDLTKTICSLYLRLLIVMKSLYNITVKNKYKSAM